MIITRKYANSLVRDGLARIEGTVTEQFMYETYVVLTRFDIERTDHYKINDNEVAEFRQRYGDITSSQ